MPLPASVAPPGPLTLLGGGAEVLTLPWASSHTPQGEMGTSPPLLQAGWKSSLLLLSLTLQGEREGESRLPGRCWAGGLAGVGQFCGHFLSRREKSVLVLCQREQHLLGILGLCPMVFPSCWLLQLQAWDNDTGRRPGDPCRVIPWVPAGPPSSLHLCMWGQGLQV